MGDVIRLKFYTLFVYEDHSRLDEGQFTCSFINKTEKQFVDFMQYAGGKITLISSRRISKKRYDEWLAAESLEYDRGRSGWPEQVEGEE